MDCKDPIQRLYDALEAEAIEEAEHWNPSPPLRFRASEAARCRRQIWYRLRGYKPAPDSAFLKLLQVQGNVDQDIMRELFRKYKIPIEGVRHNDDFSQTELDAGKRTFEVTMPDGSTEEVIISCRLDGVLPETPDGEAALEFKTMGDKVFFWLQGAFDGKLKAWPKGGLEAVINRLQEKHEGYWAQMQMSAAVFEKDRIYFAPKDRSMAQYGVRDKKTDQRFGINVPRDQAYIDQKLVKLAGVKRAVIAGVAPQPDYMDGTTECSYCSFYQHCHGAMHGGAK